NHATVEAELHEHGHGLAGLPRILCLSKADLVPPAEVEAAVRDWEQRVAAPAATGAGVPELRDAIFERVPADEPARPEAEQPATHRVYRPGEGESFTVERVGPGVFRVEGGRI